MPGEIVDTVGTPVEPAAPDTSIFEAKIAEQNAAIAARDATIASLTADLSVSKAANYDLVMAVPKESATPLAAVTIESNDSTVGIDDLFESSK